MTQEQGGDTERDLEAFRMLLQLWMSENPVKTTKLQLLLAVNAILIAAVQLGGGFVANNWVIYLAGTIFSLVWTLSIGRTSLFQDVWQAKIHDLRAKHPGDVRFSVLETEAERKQARLLLRVLGGVPSRWYLLFTPFGFAVAWLLLLIFVGRAGL